MSYCVRYAEMMEELWTYRDHRFRLRSIISPHLKERFVEQGLDSALERKPQSTPRKVTFDGEFEARLTALACSPAPDGRVRWTIRLTSHADSRIPGNGLILSGFKSKRNSRQNLPKFHTDSTQPARKMREFAQKRTKPTAQISL